MAHITLNFQSNALFRNTTVDIVIPAETMAGFPPRTTEYKTVYLLHGFSGDSKHWLLNAPIVELSQLTQTVFVMPSGDNTFYVDGEAGFTKYSKFIGEELVDFTRRVLPLSKKREDTTIAGLSMGGYGAIHNGLKYHETFGHIIALSASLCTDLAVASQTATELDMLAHDSVYYERIFGDLSKLENSDKNPLRQVQKILAEATDVIDLYLACGWNDKLVTLSRDFVRKLRELNFLHTYEEDAGSHEWASWNKQIRRGLSHALGMPIADGIPSQFNPFYVEETDFE